MMCGYRRESRLLSLVAVMMLVAVMVLGGQPEAEAFGVGLAWPDDQSISLTNNTGNRNQSFAWPGSGGQGGQGGQGEQKESSDDDGDQDDDDGKPERGAGQHQDLLVWWLFNFSQPFGLARKPFYPTPDYDGGGFFPEQDPPPEPDNQTLWLGKYQGGWGSDWGANITSWPKARQQLQEWLGKWSGRVVPADGSGSNSGGSNSGGSNSGGSNSGGSRGSIILQPDGDNGDGSGNKRSSGHERKITASPDSRRQSRKRPGFLKILNLPHQGKKQKMNWTYQNDHN